MSAEPLIDEAPVVLVKFHVYHGSLVWVRQIPIEFEASPGPALAVLRSLLLLNLRGLRKYPGAVYVPLLTTLWNTRARSVRYDGQLSRVSEPRRAARLFSRCRSSHALPSRASRGFRSCTKAHDTAWLNSSQPVPPAARLTPMRRTRDTHDGDAMGPTTLRSRSARPGLRRPHRQGIPTLQVSPMRPERSVPYVPGPTGWGVAWELEPK